MKRYALKLGEPLAIKPSAIERDESGFFVIVGDSAPENEKRGTVVVVHVRGALCQFKGDGGDSYEAIVERVHAAFDSDPKPSSVVLCISSPGGVVAGLNEAVFKIQRLRVLEDVPLIAYVNELAASAAFALACACDRRFAPPSAIVGSIGTISTMISQARRDAAEGFDFQIITSGKRKSDGHPHAALSDAAVKAEKGRNAQLAQQFFALAGKALRKSPRYLEGLEAAIYVGDNARKVGLINAVRSFDETIAGLDKTDTKPPPVVAPNDGNVTDRRAKELDTAAHSGTTLQRMAQTDAKAQTGSPQEAHMAKANLKALISRTEAAISTETDPAQLRILEAKLGTFLARAEMDDDGDDDGGKKKPDDDEDDDEEDDDEESKAAKAAKKAEEAKKAEAKAKIKSKRADAKAKHEKLMAELDEEEKKCESEDEEDEEEEASSKALSAGAAAALASQSTITSEALTRIQKLEKSAEARELAAMIDEAKAARRITPGEAKTLAKKNATFVRDFLEMRPKALVATDEEALSEPDRSAAADIPSLAKQMVEADIKHQGLTGEKADKYRETSYAAHRAAKAGSANGAAGVY